MRALAAILLMGCFGFIHAGQDHVFRSQDHRLKVYHGDTVAILADSAYIISAAQALLLNEKLLAFQSAQQANAELIQTNAALLSRVQSIEKQVTKLLQRMRADHRLVQGNLLLLLGELDQSIAFLQEANAELATTNELLTAQLQQMDRTVLHLRQANRRLAWQQTRDKVALALVALGLGFLIGSL